MRLSVKIMHILIFQSALCVTAAFLSLQTQKANSEKNDEYVMVTCCGQ